jgi:hypothetical protein
MVISDSVLTNSQTMRGERVNISDTKPATNDTQTRRTGERKLRIFLQPIRRQAAQNCACSKPTKVWQICRGGGLLGLVIAAV